MRIMHVSKKYPHALGGDAVVVASLQKQQQAAGHNVAVVTSNCDEIPSNKHTYKVGLKDTPATLDAVTFKRVISLLVMFFRMFTILKQERPDVIHTHSIDMAFFVSFAARRYGIPMVHTFHIVTFYGANQSFIRRKSELWLAKKAKLQSATAPNAYDVKKLQTAGLHQAVLLPNGVDLELWEKRGYTEKSKKFTFLAFGRLEPQKGYAELIEAAAQLADTRAQTRAFDVIIAGDGSQKALLHKLVQALHIENIVSIVGRKDQREIHTLLAEVDAAVFPSLYETTPLTLLEAWAATVPTIATSVGILRDVPDDFNAAYIVPPKNHQELARAMRRCMDDEALRGAIAANGYEQAKKYAWPTIAKNAEAIYRSVR